MARTRPRGQPKRKQSDTSKSKEPGPDAKRVLLCSPCKRLKEREREREREDREGEIMIEGSK